MRKKPILLGTGVFVLGVALGAATGTQHETVKTVQVPGPAQTVEVPGPERTVTVELPAKTIEVTPPSCIRALDTAVKAFGYAQEGFEAMSTLDASKMQSVARKLQSIDSEQLGNDSGDCRSKAQ